MARPLRIESLGAVYQVTSRGHARDPGAPRAWSLFMSSRRGFGSLAVSQREIHGFASPPRGGFALIDSLPEEYAARYQDADSQDAVKNHEK